MVDYARSNRASSTALDLGLFLIRLILGIVLMYHGSQKIFGWFGGPGIAGFAGFLEKLQVPVPLISAWMAACAEFFGGLLILIGLGTRLIAIPVVITMLVAIITVHRHAFGSENGGMEFPLTLAVVTAGIALTGAGRFSLDWAIRRGRLRDLNENPYSS